MSISNGLVTAPVSHFVDETNNLVGDIQSATGLISKDLREVWETDLIRLGAKYKPQTVPGIMLLTDALRATYNYGISTNSYAMDYHNSGHSADASDSYARLLDFDGYWNGAPTIIACQATVGVTSSGNPATLSVALSASARTETVDFYGFFKSGTFGNKEPDFTTTANHGIGTSSLIDSTYLSKVIGLEDLHLGVLAGSSRDYCVMGSLPFDVDPMTGNGYYLTDPTDSSTKTAVTGTCYFGIAVTGYVESMSTINGVVKKTKIYACSQALSLTPASATAMHSLALSQISTSDCPRGRYDVRAGIAYVYGSNDDTVLYPIQSPTEHPANFYLGVGGWSYPQAIFMATAYRNPGNLIDGTLTASLNASGLTSQQYFYVKVYLYNGWNNEVSLTPTNNSSVSLLLKGSGAVTTTDGRFTGTHEQRGTLMSMGGRCPTAYETALAKGKIMPYMERTLIFRFAVKRPVFQYSGTISSFSFQPDADQCVLYVDGKSVVPEDYSSSDMTSLIRLTVTNWSSDITGGGSDATYVNASLTFPQPTIQGSTGSYTIPWSLRLSRGDYRSATWTGTPTIQYWRTARHPNNTSGEDEMTREDELVGEVELTTTESSVGSVSGTVSLSDSTKELMDDGYLYLVFHASGTCVRANAGSVTLTANKHVYGNYIPKPDEGVPEDITPEDTPMT